MMVVSLVAVSPPDAAMRPGNTRAAGAAVSCLTGRCGSLPSSETGWMEDDGAESRRAAGARLEGSVRARANGPVWPAAAPLVGIGTSGGPGMDGLRMLRLGGGGGAAGAHRPEIGRAHV